MERITAEFTNLNKETVGNACKRFWSCQEAVVEANGDFFFRGVVANVLDCNIVISQFELQ